MGRDFLRRDPELRNLIRTIFLTSSIVGQAQIFKVIDALSFDQFDGLQVGFFFQCSPIVIGESTL